MDQKERHWRECRYKDSKNISSSRSTPLEVPVAQTGLIGGTYVILKSYYDEALTLETNDKASLARVKGSAKKDPFSAQCPLGGGGEGVSEYSIVCFFL